MSNHVYVYEDAQGRLGVVIPTPEALATMTEAEIIAKSIPAGRPYDTLAVSALPSRTFRGAWRKGSGVINIDMPTAKSIAHDKRRAIREAKFAPYDDIIAKQLPTMSPEAAEQARVAIRAQDATVQADIDAASTPDTLEAILVSYEAS